MRRRLAAIVALVVGAATVALAVAVAVSEFPRGLGLLACVVVAGAAAWYGVLRRGAVRVAGLTVAAWRSPVPWRCSSRAGRRAPICWSWRGCWCRWRPRAPRSPSTWICRTRRRRAKPVLFFNPRSGGGKAERFALADEARARGIEPIELKPGEDLETLVRGAVDRGADGLAMAGGDGSQAIVAALAAEHGLPYACVPAGTRNHFALDLGVDRDDVVGALDAFVDGGERTVDLAEVNGRVFVNNVSLGLYAEAVQREGYRDAKLRTLLDTVPDMLGPGGGELDLRWTGPGGHVHHAGAMVLVSNNRYRLGRAVGSGTRPRIDDGLLGVTVVGDPSERSEGGRRLQRPWREWSAPTFEVDADRPDPRRNRRRGAHARPAAALSHPARRPARAHRAPAPGASPSAVAPEGTRAGVLELARIATGHDQKPEASTPRRPQWT